MNDIYKSILDYKDIILSLFLFISFIMIYNKIDFIVKKIYESFFNFSPHPEGTGTRERESKDNNDMIEIQKKINNIKIKYIFIILVSFIFIIVFNSIIPLFSHASSTLNTYVFFK